MGLAFEVTRDDVWQVAVTRGVYLDDEGIEAAYAALDTDAVEAAAMTEYDLEDQTFAAYMEIAEQLERLGVLVPLDSGTPDPVQ